MKALFTPLIDLVSSLYNFLSDMAKKAMDLAKPVVVLGLLIDLVSGKLGWIDHILAVYRKTLEFTAEAPVLIVVIVAIIILAFIAKK